MIIEVYRDDGAREGAPVIEPMLADDALIHRGTAEMDAAAHAFNAVEMDIVFRPGLRLGQVVEAADPASPTAYRAKITGIQISVTAAGIDTQLTLEAPR